MSITSVLAESIGDSVSRSPLIHGHNTKTVDIGCDGCTVSCGALGDVSLYRFWPLRLMRRPGQRLLITTRFYNSAAITQLMVWW